MQISNIPHNVAFGTNKTEVAERNTIPRFAEEKDTVEFSTKPTAEKDKNIINFEIPKKSSIQKLKLEGAIDDCSFDITADHKILRNRDTITGKINDKEINAKFKDGFSERKLEGTYNDKPIDLTVERTLSGITIKGTFNDKPIDLKIKSGFTSYHVKGENADFKLQTKGLFNQKISATGKYDGDKELLPIIMDLYSRLLSEDFLLVTCLM